MPGAQIVSLATVRVTAAGTPRPVFTTKRFVQSIAVTACEANSGTIYIVDGPTKVRVTKLAIPLTPRQTFTFTGTSLAGSPTRDIACGTALLYIDANKDADRAIITFLAHEA